MVPMVLPESQVLRVHKVLKVKQEPLVLRDLKVYRAFKANRVHKVLRVKRVLQAILVRRDLKVLRARKAKQVQPVLQDHKVRKALKVQQVPLVHRVLRENRVLLVLLALELNLSQVHRQVVRKTHTQSTTPMVPLPHLL